MVTKIYSRKTMRLLAEDLKDLLQTHLEDPEGTYIAPAHGWTCFFCGETFTTPGSAQDHFGNTPIATSGCRIKFGEERGLQMALRRAEKELESYRAEDSEKDRAMRAMEGRHHLELQRAEEAGYARGLKDSIELTLGVAEGEVEAAGSAQGRVVVPANVHTGRS